MLVRIGTSAPYLIKAGTVTSDIITSTKAGFAIESGGALNYSSMGTPIDGANIFHKIDTLAESKFVASGGKVRVYSESSSYEEYIMARWPASFPSTSVLCKEIINDSIIDMLAAIIGLPVSGGYVAIYSYGGNFYISMTGPYYYLYFTQEDNEVILASSPSLSLETINTTNADGSIRTRTLGELQGTYAKLDASILRTYSIDNDSVKFEISNTSDKFELNSGIQYGPRITFNMSFEDENYSIRSLLNSYNPNDGKIEYGGIYPGLGSYKINTDDANSSYTLMLYPDGFDFHIDSYHIYINKKSPYEDGGFSGQGGGGGNFGEGDSADPVGDVPNGSSELDVTDSGLFSMYACSEGDLFTLGAALYTEDILAAIGKEIMSFLWNSPIEGVIGLCSYPFSLPLGAPKNLKFGALELPVQMTGVDKSFMQIDWGTISLNEYWGNFLDYGPHTKIDLYLPWGVGFVPIDPHECLPGTLSVVTNIELAKGTCVHIVSGNIGQIGTYSGVCGSMLPVTAIDTSGKLLAGVTSAVTTLVSAGAGAVAGQLGNEAGRWKAASIEGQSLGYAKEALQYGEKKAEMALAKAASYQAVSARYAKAALGSAVAAFRTPAQVQRNGGFSNSGAGLGIQNPFVIISRPEQNVPEDYGHYFGYPSNISEYLENLRGYTEVADIHLTGISATLNELNEIESLLKGGVVL